MKKKWSESSPKRDTSDETMYQVGFKEGQREGLNAFLSELERLAHD